MHTLSPRQRRTMGRIFAAAVLLVLLHWIPVPEQFPLWTLYLVPYLIIGGDVVRRAAGNITRGQVFDENFLMTLATVGAFFTAEYAEAVFVMLFYQVGELFQDIAVNRSRASIAALMDIRPDTARVERGGAMTEVDPEDVKVGEILVIRPGERVPLDGEILEGESSLDTAALTGESVPRDVGPGDAVISGCVNQTGLLRVRAVRPCEESTVSRILELVENAGEKKAPSEQFITRFSRYYTPCVVIAAAALFLLPTLALAMIPQAAGFLAGTSWHDWLHRALVFLVVSCPCALVISVPLSFFGGIGGAGRRGILIKGGTYLEALSHADTVVFDKTGTLTQGTFAVTEICPASGFDRETLSYLAAQAEQHSSHPIAQSLRAASPSPLDPARITEVEETAGSGVCVRMDGQRVCVGSRRLMEKEGVTVPYVDGTAVHVAVDGVYAGYLILSDLPRPDAAESIRALKAQGVRRVVMLTGDAPEAAARMARQVGVDEVRDQLLPQDKVAELETLLSRQPAGGRTVYVGDGINDAPVLSRADVGIAMGAMGSDAAIEAADIVLMDDRLSKLPEAMAISRRTMTVVRQNIWFALGVKFGVLVLGALGMASMWAAVFADVGVAFLAILNAMRCLRPIKH